MGLRRQPSGTCVSPTAIKFCQGREAADPGRAGRRSTAHSESSSQIDIQARARSPACNHAAASAGEGFSRAFPRPEVPPLGSQPTGQPGAISATRPSASRRFCSWAARGSTLRNHLLTNDSLVAHPRAIVVAVAFPALTCSTPEQSLAHPNVARPRRRLGKTKCASVCGPLLARIHRGLVTVVLRTDYNGDRAIQLTLV